MMTDSDATRRGRPRGSEGEALLDAARSVFVDRGFAGTTMAAVAASARVSKASLYREHPSKDALYAAVVADWVVQGRDAMRPHVDRLVEAGGTEDALLSFARVLQAGVLDPDVLAMRRLVSSQADSHPEVASLYLHDGWDRNIAMLGAALADLRERGALIGGDPRVMAAQFTWLVLAEPLNAHALGAGPLSRAGLRTIAVEAVALFTARHRGP